MALDVVPALGLQRHGQHLLGGQADELVQAHRLLLTSRIGYPQHPAYSSRPASPATDWTSGRVRLLISPELIHNFRVYLGKDLLDIAIG